MSFADEPAELAMQQLTFEGIPFGQRPALLRRDGSKFYEKSYLEASAVARALVAMNAHVGAINVRRAQPPQPDVVVDYGDRQLFVEQAMILDAAAMEADVAIEDANFALRDAAAGDPQLRALFAGGVFTVRLQSVDVAGGVDKRALANETLALAATISGDVSLLRPDAHAYPVLAASGALVFYRSCAAVTTAPIEAHDLDRWTEYEPALQRVLSQKHAAVAGYDPACRPIWLVLSVSSGFELMPNLVEVTKQVIGDLGSAGFDRVAVQLPRRAPLVVDGV